MKHLVVLGATGTVGRNTLDVAARHRDKLEVVGLSAGRNVDELFALIRTHAPRYAALADELSAVRLRERLRWAGIRCEVLSGGKGLAELAAHADADTVMSAIVGAAGLMPTLAAVRAGKRVLIANKEPLVMAGTLMVQEAATHGATLIPIDSEHNAIFQCLPQGFRCGTRPAGVRRLILTASGGPFREWTAERMAQATAAEAVRHPRWTMGAKISVDSATLMNKGLELIEASVLYTLPSEALDVVVHPESLIHSLVEYADGSMLAQLGQPDMRVPIAHALAWPERWESGVGGVDLPTLGRMHFEAPDLVRFPCLGLARAAMQRGGIAPNVLNAANEIVVEAFLKGAARFTQIAAMVEESLSAAESAQLPQGSDLDSVLAVDGWTRSWCGDRLRVC
jgi:1-deoxy-D-xylulose-5-phosphate reductoisomerase